MKPLASTCCNTKDMHDQACHEGLPIQEITWHHFVLSMKVVYLFIMQSKVTISMLLLLGYDYNNMFNTSYMAMSVVKVN